MHATTIKEALSILVDGEANPSSGICGDGIYCFACKSPNNDDIIETWDRGIRGRYNGGAAILMESHGMLCRSCDENDILCSGIIANRKDQYSAGPRTVSYMLAIFETDALVTALHRYLDTQGYSQQLHGSLREIQKWVQQNQQPGPSWGRVDDNLQRINRGTARVATVLQQIDRAHPVPWGPRPSSRSVGTDKETWGVALATLIQAMLREQ